MSYETAVSTDAGTSGQNTSETIRSRNIVVRNGRLSVMGKFILAIAIFIVAFALGVAVGGNDHRKR